MKVMIFVDYENFCNSIKNADPERKDQINQFSNFIIDYLRQNTKLGISQGDRIRTYVYTGEFTDNILNKINKQLERDSENEELAQLREHVKKQQAWQKKFFDATIGFDSFEVRTKPLQFYKNKIFQKGVDVQLAVDMVAHAYNNSYDVAILCSGDVDLIESIKLTKNLGKKVIVCSTWKTSAKRMRQEADIFVDLGKLKAEELDLFTVKKQKNSKHCV